MLFYDKTLVKEYDYTTSPVKGLIPIRKFGLEQDAYGGKIYPYIAELRNGLNLVINTDLETIDVFLDSEAENVSKVDMSLIRRIAKANKVTFDWNKTSKDDLIAILRG